ncbi:UGT8 [Branchiostoma lanceolatum]|uniref:UGT8 protein n=1 Tax=Branchiostoma lanceolatum TaxID=7740 RepID=A0A8K0ELC6_BRALA|nr:UGT8 [Branchiostoma lanceolatum]
MSPAQGMSFFSSLFILVFCTNFKPGRPGRILVPGPPLGSRWRLVNKVATELSRAGHDVTMLVPEGTEDNIRDIENFSLLLTSHPEAVRYYKERLNKRVSLAPNAVSFLPEDLYSALSYVVDHAKLYGLLASECEATFQQGLLNGSRFDLVLSDLLSPCAVILARHLHVPVVSVARGTPGGYDLAAAGAPTPAACVPQLGLALTDGMSLVQRLENFVVQLVTSALTGSMLLRPFDDIARKRTGLSIRDLLAGTDLWLRHTDPMFETPRPRMPNMVYIGGISASPAEPLTQELEEALARVRGENIAVVTFGSMVDQFDAHLAEVLSTALSRLPFKVVWR